MAFNFSPKAVTDGLVLYLDAANTKSIVSGSITWNDLSRSGNNGTLVGGPGYSGSNGGSIVFDGSNDYANLTTVTSFSSSQPHTYSAWIFPTAFALYKWIIDNGTTNQGTSLITNSSLVGFFWNGGSSFVTSNRSITTNTWTNVVAVYSNLSVNFYINGVFDSNKATTSFSAGNVVPKIGSWRGLSDFFAGRISQVQVYNKALTAQEVLQNYNATKTRYGL
jgi:hypothetical protein